MKVAFSSLAVAAVFHFNGNVWVKKSTRTAEITEPVRFVGRWFYFSGSDMVTI